ncbi:MAG: hypothetical protein ACT4TC_12210 [Myxococcaceae bacterium]
MRVRSVAMSAVRRGLSVLCVATCALVMRVLPIACIVAFWGACDPLAPPASRSHVHEEDIGLAVFPEDNTERHALQRWSSSLVRPPAYRFGYALSSDKAREYADAHRRYGEEVGYRYLGEDRITFHTSERCGFDLRCVYEQLLWTNQYGVSPIAERFLNYARGRHLSSSQLSMLIITYVQSLRYERPRNEPFDILPPALVAARRTGDCDSKALLAYMLLKGVGVDCVLLRAASLQHVALGVRLPASGFSVPHQGKRYFYVEMTYPDWPVGTVPPEYQRAAAWKALPVE